MNIAVIGAGVNGVCSVIKFAEVGNNVNVYDRGNAFSETSSESLRMFHGCIRYLEFWGLRPILKVRSQWILVRLAITHKLRSLEKWSIFWREMDVSLVIS